jgi:FkbM family methyltransferase
MRALLHKSVNLLPMRWRRWIKHVPGVAALQRRVVERYLTQAPFVHTIRGGAADGLRFEVTLPLDKAVWLGLYEEQFASALRAAVARGDVCYDIGGYRGYMTGVMALAGAGAVYTFEPLPGNRRALERLRALNPALPVTIVPAAIGDTDGEARLGVMPDNSMGKLASSTFQPDAHPIASIAVPVRRLDSLARAGEIPPPSVMKIDVEGAEVDVLRGAAEVLAAHRPRIFLEAHNEELEAACRIELLRHGYVIRRLDAPASSEQTRHLAAERDHG